MDPSSLAKVFYPELATLIKNKEILVIWFPQRYKISHFMRPFPTTGFPNY